MNWILLTVAGLFECGWAIGVKYSEGLTKPGPLVFAVFAMAVSLVLLALAMRTIPIGTAYAVWTGIGTVCVATLGVLLFGEPATVARALCIVAILAGVIGLRFIDG